MKRLSLWLVPPFVTLLVFIASFAFMVEQNELRSHAGQRGPRWAVPLIACSVPGMAIVLLYGWRREKVNQRFLRWLAELDVVGFGCLYVFNALGCLSILAVSGGLVALGFAEPGVPAPRWVAWLCLSGAIAFILSMFGLGATIQAVRGDPADRKDV